MDLQVFVQEFTNVIADLALRIQVFWSVYENGYQFRYALLLCSDLASYVKQLKIIRLGMGTVLSMCMHLRVFVWVYVLAVVRSGTACGLILVQE